jgi:hypothetical protein
MSHLNGKRPAPGTPRDLPLYVDLKLSAEAFQHSRLLARHRVEKLGEEEILIAGDRAVIPPGETRVVYRVSEFPIIRRLSEGALREAHEVKRLFGGALVEPEPEPPALERVGDIRLNPGGGWCYQPGYLQSLVGDPPFLAKLYQEAARLGFPAVKTRHLTLYGEPGWWTFCQHHSTTGDWQREVWQLLADIEDDKALFDQGDE